jgi:hypothetical protein
MKIIEIIFVTLKQINTLYKCFCPWFDDSLQKNSLGTWKQKNLFSHFSSPPQHPNLEISQQNITLPPLPIPPCQIFHIAYLEPMSNWCHDIHPLNPPTSWQCLSAIQSAVSFYNRGPMCATLEEGSMLVLFGSKRNFLVLVVKLLIFF